MPEEMTYSALRWRARPVFLLNFAERCHVARDCVSLRTRMIFLQPLVSLKPFFDSLVRI